MNKRLLIALFAATSLASAGAASAQHWHDHGFYGRDFHSFGPREFAIWRGGHWVHDVYLGVFGWWWVVDGVWYPYAAPAYPYPTYVSSPPPGASPGAGGAVWYHCAKPDGYYPYVGACPGGWTVVPASPPDMGGKIPPETEGPPPSGAPPLPSPQITPGAPPPLPEPPMPPAPQPPKG